MVYDVMMPRGMDGAVQLTEMEVELALLAVTLRGAEGAVRGECLGECMCTYIEYYCIVLHW